MARAGNYSTHSPPSAADIPAPATAYNARLQPVHTAPELIYHPLPELPAEITIVYVPDLQRN